MIKVCSCVIHLGYVLQKVEGILELRPHLMWAQLEGMSMYCNFKVKLSRVNKSYHANNSDQTLSMKHRKPKVCFHLTWLPTRVIDQVTKAL